MILLRIICLFFALWFTGLFLGKLWYKNGDVAPLQSAAPAFFWTAFWAVSQILAA